MSLLKNASAASAAIDVLANTPGTTPFDRAQQLSSVSRRLDDHVRRLSAEAEKARSTNPISQREGD